MGDIAQAVSDHAHKNGYTVVREIGGHGVGLAFHEDPWVGYVGRRGTAKLHVPGKDLKIAEKEGKNMMIVKIDTTMSQEAYRLNISKKKIEITAATPNGVRYALQTVKQLLPVAIYGERLSADENWSVPCATINDAPRFGYRGMHLDVARHFFTLDEVKRILNVMAVHKLNTLHWHLTDDQGWRVEIKKYPRLPEVGSIRNKTMIRKEWDNYDTTPYGGFYTQEQAKEIVDYAAERYITVVPEIDLPGHMQADLAAYQEMR